MGQTNSNLYTQTYGGYFRPKFDSAITYNKSVKGITNSYTNVDQLTSTTQTFQQIMQIFNMLQKKEADDFITYLLILQSNPINIILQGQTITTYNFNVAPNSSDIKSAPSVVNGTQGSDGVRSLFVNLTGKDDTTPETLEDDITTYNAWMLSSDGKIHYVVNTQGNADSQRGIAIFKCLADWFNSLDNIQNQYIQYLFNVRNPTQSYIKMLVNQADLTYSNYASVLNDLLEKRVKNITVLSKKDSISVYAVRPDSDEKIKLRLELGEFGQIEKSYFGNGEEISNGGNGEGESRTYGWETGNMQKLGYYGYNITTNDELKTLNKSKVYDKDNVGKMWRILWNGQWYVLTFGKTYYSPAANVYDLVPLDAFLRLVYNTH